MKVYNCLYHYRRGRDLIEENHNVLADSPEQVKNLLCKILGINELSYFTYSQVGDEVVAISSEIVDKICRDELERTKQRQKLKVSEDTIRYPTPDQKKNYEDKRDELSPRPFTSKVKDMIMKDYK